jgi:RNA 2',3'-cyclic 3'-phosphodiesterase
MRLFIATSFPESVTREINERVAAVKSKLPPASWVRPESQHLTFAFLGEQDESLIDKIAPEMESHLRGAGKFSAVLHGCGFFPNSRRARVGWVGIEPEQPFAGIAHRVRDVVTRSGIELDRADFHPHLTLMRIREGWPPASIETLEGALHDYRSTPFVVDTVTLYSSRLSPSGAVHAAVRQFALA